ncbi:hypothetical protein [Planctomicrobium sp. SH527]|uniref:hypothetical protein n=1 Tax=Planctomicrobium sp. SH527 TaxID=3448123 RepID=UPI003F5C3488
MNAPERDPLPNEKAKTKTKLAPKTGPRGEIISTLPQRGELRFINRNSRCAGTR